MVQPPQQPYNNPQVGYGPSPQQPLPGQPPVPSGPQGGYGQPGQMPPPGMPLQDPNTMPGTVITVRVLMFIGGGLGILGALGIGLLGLLGVGLGQATGSLAQDPDAAMVGNIVGGLALVIALIPLTYAVVSIVLAAKMGKRSSGVFWGVIVFQGLAAALLLLNVILGEGASFVLLIFAVLMLTLMFLPASRAYYQV